MSDTGALKVLQSELLALKEQYGKALSLKKTKPGASQASPFPVTVTVTVSAPESAYAFDVNCLKLRLGLEGGILSFVGQIEAGNFAQKETEKYLQIAVVNEDLPRVLCEAISLELKRYWEKSVGAVKRGFLLDGLLLYAKSHFVDLIGSVPSCIEPYESVDESGASVRRFAIVNPVIDENEVVNSEESTSTNANWGEHAGVAPATHSIEDSSTSPTLSPEAETPLMPPLAKEMSMIRLRFGEANFRIHEDMGNKPDPSRVRFSVTIDPSDPDWEEGPLDFNGEANILESGGLGVWVRLAPSTPLPWNVRIFVDGILRKESADVKGKSNAGRCLLKFVEGHIAEVVRKGENFQGTGEELGYINQDMGFDDQHTESDSSEETESDGGYEEQHGEPFSGEEDNPDGVFFGGDAGAVSLNSYNVNLEGLQLDNVDVMEGLQLAFQVSCSRCKGMSVATVASPAVLQTQQSNSKSWDTFGSCTSCHEDWSLSFTPKMIHERSNSLGWVSPHGCLAVDLLPSHFMVQCSCGAVTSLRGVQVGAGAGKGCNRCGKAMVVKYGGVSLVPKSEEKAAKKKPLKSSQDSKPNKKQNMAFQVPLKPGEPLPNKGTCQHYRHSHRWLRFPCCGMRFPCDLCHELGTDGHEMKWAVRMVCGYCSVEQALGERCKSCNKKLAGTGANPSGRKTRFWEGGQGCRDKSKLDKRDAKKYKNSKKKTKSNKANRVGPKAKNKTATAGDAGKES